MKRGSRRILREGHATPAQDRRLAGAAAEIGRGEVRTWTAIEAIAVALALVTIVWLKIVRPVRGDLAWSRQTERIAKAKADRVARRRKRERPA